jgi:hypothetical protein
MAAGFFLLKDIKQKGGHHHENDAHFIFKGSISPNIQTKERKNERSKS